MIARRQAINVEELGPALLDASLSITDDAFGLTVLLSAPDAILRLEISRDGQPNVVATWYEGDELCTYEAALLPSQSATGTASSSVSSWQLTRVSYAPQNGAADDADGR